MTSKLVVNTIEADTGISSVSFASSISLSSTSKFFFSDAGIDIGADTNINRPATGVIGFNINSGEKVRITSGGNVGIGTDNPQDNLHISDNSPGILLTDSNAAANTKNWSITAGVSQLLRIQAQNDSYSGGGNLFDFYRSGNQVNEFRGMNSGAYWFVVDNSNQKVGIGTSVPSAKLEVRDGASTGIIVRSNSTQSTDTNKALRVRNNSDTNVFSVSHKGFTEIKRGELGTYLKVGGDDASNGRALTFTSSNTTSNGALHTIEAISGNGAIALATAGSEKFRVDRDGYVTKPQTPAFFATHTGAGNNITGYLIFDTSGPGYYNNGNHFNVSTGAFTAPVDGIYHFHFHGFIHQTSSTGNFQVHMDRTNVGGGGIVQVSRNYSRKNNSNAYGPAISLHYTGPMTAGQYMRVSTNKGFHGSNGYFFGGYLIG